VLEIGDFVGASGTLNSWSLTVTPVGGSSAVAAGATQPSSMPAALPPSNQMPPTQPVTNTAIADPGSMLPAGQAANLDVGNPIVVQPAAEVHTPRTGYGQGSTQVSIGSADLPASELGGEVVM
jgi:hypothetical protein